MELVRDGLYANGDDERKRRGGRMGQLPSGRKVAPTTANTAAAGAAGAGGLGNGDPPDPPAAALSAAPALVDEVSGVASLKWGTECMAIIPDDWLLEEVQRRSRTKTLASADIHPAREEAATGEVAAAAPRLLLAVSSFKVPLQLCNTGKCEMFD
jgi:hypothetical protein